MFEFFFWYRRTGRAQWKCTMKVRNIKYLYTSGVAKVMHLQNLGRIWYDYLPHSYYWNEMICWNSKKKFLTASELFRFSKKRSYYHDVQTHSSSVPEGEDLSTISRILGQPCQELTFSPWPYELLLLGWWKKSFPQVSATSQLQTVFVSHEALQHQLSCKSTNTLKLNWIQVSGHLIYKWQ